MEQKHTVVNTKRRHGLDVTWGIPPASLPSSLEEGPANLSVSSEKDLFQLESRHRWTLGAND